MEEGGGKSVLIQLPLIPQSEINGREANEESSSLRGRVIEEAKKQIRLAGPLIGVSLLQYSLQVISIMFVGHLGELPLSSASMATSFASVTGFSVLVIILF